MTFERKNIAAMQGYSYGEQPQDGNTIKLNTNESPYPASPNVAAALASFDASNLRIYPNATADGLRDRVAQLHGVQRDNVVITHGGDEALRLALTTFVTPGANFGMAEPSYSLYPVLAGIQDAVVQTIDLDEQWRLPLDAAAQWNQLDTQLTCLVNPHAPSGTLAAAEQVAAFANELNGILLLDEAYADFVEPEQQYNAVPLLQQHKNLLILRTFSKGYGLAGLRLGYLLGDESLITPIVEKTRDSYNIDPISQALGCAAIDDQDYAQGVWQQVRTDRKALAAGLAQLGFTQPDSQTNFVLSQVPNGVDAQELYSALKARHILVRYFDTPRLSNKLRITVGTAAENQQLVAALTELLQSA